MTQNPCARQYTERVAVSEQNQEQWDALIGDLYDAALDPSLLEPALARFERLIGSQGCHLFATDEAMNPVLHAWTIDWMDPERVARDYYGHYIHEDPRRATVMLGEVGVAQQCTESFDARYVSRSGFYQDFLIPMGARYVAGGNVIQHQGLSGVVAFNRPVGCADFTDHDVQLIQRYMPHLCRAVRLITDREISRLRSVASEQVLAAQEMGVMVLDARGRILHANPVAEHWAGQMGWGLRGAMASSPALQTLRQGALLKVRPHALRLTSPKGAQAIAMAWAWRAERGASWLEQALGSGHEEAWRAGHLVVLIKPVRAQATLAPSLLMDLFGLSAAEARLAHALGEGLTLEEAAARYQVSINTVRTQLRGVLAKTGCARQADLVALLASLPSPG